MKFSTLLYYSRGIDAIPVAAARQVIDQCSHQDMATKPDSPVPMLDDDPYDGLRVRVLRLGPEFSYKVPSFSVLTVDLRQATMQIERVDSDGEIAVQCTDGFIRSDAQLDRIICPFLLTLSNSCLVPVSL